MRGGALTGAMMLFLALAVAAAAEQPRRASRNENSTPRSSILPLNPAVAAQKLKDEAAGSTDVVLWSKAVLLSQGYNVGSLDEKITARFTAAVFKYQRHHGLASTGKLSLETVTELSRAIP